jgi:isocitrate dehydrogenase
MDIQEVLKILGIIVSLATGTIGIAISLITRKRVVAERDNIVADTANKFIDTSKELVDQIYKQLDSCKEEVKCYAGEVKETRKENMDLKDEVDQVVIENNLLKQIVCTLIDQLKEHNIIPRSNYTDCDKLKV